mgnify:CR=1 FL=1
MRSFIEDGGYVASCLFKDGEFVFDITNDLNYARRFAGSKYVKSNPEGIYKKIAQKLKEGNKGYVYWAAMPGCSFEELC